MRRPLALAGFSLLLSTLLCILLGTRFALILGSVSLVLLFLLFLKSTNNSRLVTSLRGCCFFFLCGCLGFFLQFQMQVAPLLPLENQTKYVQYTVLEEQGTYDDVAYYTVSAKGLYPDPDKDCQFRLSMAYPHRVAVGDHAGGMVTFSTSSSPTLMADHVYLTATALEEVSPTLYGKEFSFSYYTHQVRESISALFAQQGTKDTLSLVKGICLGNADGMSEELQNAFYSCGLGHLVAVSGLHTSQIGGVFIALFLFLTKSKRWVKLCSLGFVWGFVEITGFSYSSLRAAIMFSFFAVGSCVFRRMDSLNTLGGAVTAIVLCNPFAAYNLGFLASVGACLGIILFTTPLQQKLQKLLPEVFQTNKILSYLLTGFCTTLSATATTIPCNLLAFHTLSPIAPLSNLLCIPLGTAILVLGLCGAVMSFIPPFSFVGTLCLWVAHGLAFLIAQFATILSKIPYHVLPQSTPITFFIIVLCGVGIAWILLYPNRFKGVSKLLVVVLLCLGILSSSFLPALPQNTQEICILATEYDAAMVVMDKDTTILIGSIAPRDLDRYLGSRGITHIDLWVLPQRDNYSTALTSLPKQYQVDEIMTFLYADTLGLLSNVDKNIPIHFLNSMTLGKVKITALDNYSVFVIKTPNTTLYFGDTRGNEQQLQEYPFAFLNRKSGYADVHILHDGKEVYPINQTTVIRATPNGCQVYQPRFVF